MGRVGAIPSRGRAASVCAVSFGRSNGGEFYDLREDPGETRNLFADAARQPIVRDTKDRLPDWPVTSGETDQIAPKWQLQDRRQGLCGAEFLVGAARD